MSLPTLVQFRSAFPELSTATDLTVQHALDSESGTSETTWGSDYVTLVLNLAAITVATPMVKPTAVYQAVVDRLTINRAYPVVGTLADEVAARTAADTAEATARASAITTEAAARVSGDAATLASATALPRTSTVLSPSVLDAATAARTLAALGPVIFEPTAQRSIDVPGTGGTAWDLTKAATIRVHKDTRALFGILLDVTTNGGGLWTTPAGLNQDFFLPESSEPLNRSWDVIVDGPSKTIRVITWRGPEPMISAPTASPGDTLDLFSGGTYAGHAIGGAGGINYYQTAAPTSDGSAFLTAATDNVRRLQDVGDGNGQRLLMELSRQNQVLHSQDFYSAGGAIVSPWVAIGATTGLGGVAGSPAGDATVCNLIFSASAVDGIKQAWAGSAVQTPAIYSLWVRVASGTGKCRLQALLRDATTQTSADFNLTTTWRRIDMVVGSIDPAGSAGTPEFRILNGTDAAARTIQVWGAQVECATGAMYPTSYLKTVAAVVSRTVDSLYYLSGAFPASFYTRGVSISYMPEFSNVEAWGVGAMVLCGFDNPTAGIAIAGGFDSFTMALFKGGSPYAAGAARLYLLSTDVYTVGASGALNAPRSYSEPFAFARRALLTLDAEAYRGGLRVQGAASGNGRFPAGGGPWVWPTGALAIGTSTPGPLGTGFAGSYGRYITAA